MSEEPLDYGTFFTRESGAEFDDDVAALTVPGQMTLPYETVLHGRMGGARAPGWKSAPQIFDWTLTAQCRFPCNAPGHYHPENYQAPFYEEDEPVEDISAAWERGIRGITRRPDGD